MDRQQLKDEILFKLTGGVLDCELDEKGLDLLINASLRELQRYIDSTKLITIPYKTCIDLSDYKINAVVRVYRSIGLTASTSEEISSGMNDPMYASQWQLLSGTGNLYNFNNYAYNYASWNTLLQIRNTTSTDLAFKYDKSTNKLYINVSDGRPEGITIEYVPRYDDVNEILSDFWIDMLIKLCVAQAKVALGRIRTRYKQSNALWEQDGETLLTEGNTELNELRTALVASTQLNYPID